MSDDGDEHVRPGKGKSPAYCFSMLSQKGASVCTTGTKSNRLLSPPNPPSPSLPLASDGGFFGLRNVGL